MLFAIVLLAMGGALLSRNGCGATSGRSQPPPPPGKIQHVVAIFQENRTPDNLFQDPALISRGADIVKSGRDSTGHTIQRKKISLQTDYDPVHSHQSFKLMCRPESDDGTMSYGWG
jgi:phospholipase C